MLPMHIPATDRCKAGKTNKLNDIAMPKLGCGNGGLDWETQVKPLVEKYLKKSPINVSIYDFDKVVASR